MENTEQDTNEDYIARVFPPADGWGIVRHVLNRLAGTFGGHDAFARGLQRKTVRAVLAWLRPAELLARKLLFVMACALEPAALVAGARRSREARAPKAAPPSRNGEPHTWRASFRLCIAPPPARAATASRSWRYRAPREQDLEYQLIGRYVEADAREARRALRAPFVLREGQFTPRVDRDENARDAARTASRAPSCEDGVPLARRIEALLRLAADPARRALRLARRLARAAEDMVQQFVARCVRPHDRADAGLCRAGLLMIDTLAVRGARLAFDTS